MTILDAVLFTMVAGVVTLKVFLLAAAAVLMVHVLTHRVRQRRVTAPPVRARHTGLDEYA